MSRIAHFELPEVLGEHAYYPRTMITIDDVGDVWITNEDGSLLISLEQAYRLHFQLGQALILHTRAAVGREVYSSISLAQEAANG